MVAGLLSRVFEGNDLTVSPIFCSYFAFIIDFFLSLLMTYLQETKIALDLIALQDEMKTAKLSSEEYQQRDQRIYYKGRVYISRTLAFQNYLLIELHASPIAGHWGVLKTIKRLATNFYWQGMCKDVSKFVSNCVTCQEIKSSTSLSAGLLYPLPIAADSGRTYRWITKCKEYTAIFW